MNKFSAYFIALAIALLALLPPQFITIDCTVNSTAWLWGSLMAGFLTFMFIFTKANVWVKLIVVYSYINCFLSRAPYLSFTIYFSVIICAYLYLLCFSSDWEPIFNAVQSLFLLSFLLIIMQAFKKDTLLNFGRDEAVVFGSIFNSMLLASYITCLTPFLFIKNKLYIVPVIIIALMARSSGMMLSMAAGIIFYSFFKIRNKIAYMAVVAVIILGTLTFAYQDKQFDKFFHGAAARWPVWVKTVQFVNENPYSGWGIGTFKTIFPVISGQMIEESGEKHTWLRAHNDWVQLPFELGYVGFSMLLGLAGYLMWLFKKAKKTEPVVLAMTGLVIYGTNMLIHFPTRLTQAAIILLCYLAYFETITNKKEISYGMEKSRTGNNSGRQEKGA